MAKIIFERLTVNEQEQVAAGDTTSQNSPYAADTGCIYPTSDENGCFVKHILSIDSTDCSIGGKNRTQNGNG